MKRWLVGQNGNIDRVKSMFKNNNYPVVWMHCSSLGEFEQGRTLLEAYKQKYTDSKVLVTFFSPSGYESCKNYSGADMVAYLPFDTPGNVKQFLDAVKPTVVLWIRYDFWANHLKELKRRDIPVFLISATFRKGQIFFKPWGQSFRKILNCYKFIFVQNADSLSLLKNIGIENAEAAGDTRFDRVIQVASKQIDYPIISNFTRNSKVLVVGSSWPKDEHVLAVVAKQFPDLKIILAPHEIHEQHIIDIEQLFTESGTVRYTELSDKSVINCNVLILNTIGMLSSVYRYGQAAFIGCGFDDGIHNIAEAAVYGIPVVFGPNYHKFEEANDLVLLGGAKPISNAGELTNILTKLYTDSELRAKMGEICYNYIKTNAGTTQRVLKVIESYVKL